MRFRRFHYAWVIVAVTFFSLLAAQAVRAAPGIIIVPLESEFGWDRATVSLAVAFSLITFGLGGPLGGSLIDRFGPRRVILAGNLSIIAGLAAMLVIRELWQLYVVWGVFIGLGTGAVGGVLGVAVAHRWFRKNQGVVIGAFGAATSAGQLVFVPAMAQLTVSDSWRAAITLMLAAGVAMLLPVLLFMRDRPADVGQKPVGEGEVVSAAERAQDARSTPMRVALRTSDFWLLAGSFFICGYTSNGLVGTHLIPHAIEHGFTEVTAAGAVGVMGAMNIAGTVASGWFTDRYDNRKLLAAYYGFRAISLMALPIIFDARWLYVFAVAYGLDWIATVPPTANLVATIYGRRSLGTIYGWVFFSHMIGAATAAYAGGLFRVVLGDYHAVFIAAAVLGFVAVALTRRISATGVGLALPTAALEPAAP